jgi:hypothetical protein
MNAIALGAEPGTSRTAKPPAIDYLDPLDDDQGDDGSITTTRRGLTRLALVAAEAGARFQREELGHDPVAWMLAPRRMFDGASAIEACLERRNCLRAVLLHGLSIGLDAAPARIDALLADDRVADGLDEPWPDGGQASLSGRFSSPRRQRLYSATIAIARGGELLHAFHASVAPSAAVVRERIRARLGSAAAEQATIRIGFDQNCPTTMGMVPPAVIDTLIAAGRRTRVSPDRGIDITVEQRLPS